MSMMIHRKREALRLKAAQAMQKRESSTPEMTVGTDVVDTVPAANNVEEGEDIANPAPVKRGRKKKV